MNVVYSVTRNFYEKIVPSVRSLLEYNKDVRLFVCAEDDELDVELPIRPEVINVSGQTWFAPDSINYRNRFTYINLIKVVYPSLLPVDRVLHMDADAIVCYDLTPFYDTNLDGKWIAAVDEVQGTYHPFGDNYFNMGVAVINLEQMRTDQIEPVLVEYLNRSKQPWADQDAWNKFGIEQGKFVSVPVRYNENFATGETETPAIVHYCGVSDWWTRRHMKRGEYLDRWRR